ncbi:MAG: hypothetical protein ACJA2M_000309 [Polaribacter sp.]|jgi:hypothetical protein
MQKEKDEIKIIKSIITNQLALNCNQDIKFTKEYKGKLKNFLNKMLDFLVELENKDFDPLLDISPLSLLYSAVSDTTETLSKVPLAEFGEINNILLAYKKMPGVFNNIADNINYNTPLIKPAEKDIFRIYRK